jgi:hypothetical protein
MGVGYPLTEGQANQLADADRKLRKICLPDPWHFPLASELDDGDERIESANRLRDPAEPGH